MQVKMQLLSGETKNANWQSFHYAAFLSVRGPGYSINPSKPALVIQIMFYGVQHRWFMNSFIFVDTDQVKKERSTWGRSSKYSVAGVVQGLCLLLRQYHRKWQTAKEGSPKGVDHCANSKITYTFIPLETTTSTIVQLASPLFCLFLSSFSPSRRSDIINYITLYYIL